MGSAGSGMAEKWYFRDDTLNHGIEGAERAAGLSLEPPFCLSFVLHFDTREQRVKCLTR